MPFSCSYDADIVLRVNSSRFANVNEDDSRRSSFNASPFAAGATVHRDSSGGASVASDYRTPPPALGVAISEPSGGSSKRESGLSFTDSYRTAGESEAESDLLPSNLQPIRAQ